MSKIKTAIEKALNLPTDLDFKPKKELYEKLGINQKRFGQLMKGTAVANVTEIKAIAAHFKIANIVELI